MTAQTVRTLLRYSAWLLWVAGGAVVVLGLIGVALHAADGLDGSIWEDATNPAKIVLFILGAMATFMLPVLVAHGVTRRRFTAAVTVAGAVIAVATGLFLAAGFLVEKVLYAAADLPQELSGRHLFDSAGEVHLVVLEHALLSTAYLLSGLLVGAGSYRFGHRWGLLLLLPGLLPVAAVEVILGTDWAALLLSTLDLTGPTLPLLAAAGLAVAVLALGLVAARGLIHPVAIRTRRLP